MPRSIVVVGSVNLDLVCPVAHLPAPGETLTGGDVQFIGGGKGANQAVAAARLGYPVSLVAKVGDDDFSPRLVRGLRAAGVNVRHVTAARNTPVGMAFIYTDAHGQNSIVISAGGNGRLRPSDVNGCRALLRSAGMVLVQLEVPLETVEHLAALAHRDGVPLMLDPAPARELPSRLLKRVTWLTPNETETVALCGGEVSDLERSTASAYGEALRSRGPRGVVIKMGSRGAYVTDDNGTKRFVKAFRVRAIDSTAAGDAFNAGFAVALMRGEFPANAARYASAVAAISVTRMGAQPSMPSAREVGRFLGRQRV